MRFSQFCRISAFRDIRSEHALSSERTTLGPRSVCACSLTSQTGSIRLALIGEPAPKATREADLRERVAVYRQQHPDASRNGIAKAIGGRKKKLLAVVRAAG